MSSESGAALRRRVGSVATAPVRSISDLGGQLMFYARAIAWIPMVVRKYPKEIRRLLAEVSMGSGAMAAVGGTVFVVFFLSLAIGIQVGLEAFTTFGNIGVGALSGFFSAYFNTREAAPIMACIALTATVGAGFTAQLGAMRVSEEIDALDVMAVPSVPYLVTTRIVAGMIAVVPLFAIGLITMFLATQVMVTVAFGQATGTYQHYFDTFLVPGDVALAGLKVLLTAVIIMCVCCYYGYTASGGPAGVGRSVGRAVRTSLITVMAIDLVFGIAFWGAPTVYIAG
ncbi:MULTISPECIES: MlaE family ABC transporter permease [unclassified Aeromicrobium]|jgi:phospholipid/cholesterol/gamma-HCH transport system permease protein|uniref:MlaE family ABC transporter permease n=1 Tax=unclassified Aeromicrobium TaxID=2633570 RepID=UPI0025C70DED|nr:ABC transporter permease [Aeromicrobium sp.]MCK5891661.1 ABC transporter permease [Aeromicrobium sp.]